jgi:hypothetical protein
MSTLAIFKFFWQMQSFDERHAAKTLLPQENINGRVNKIMNS